MKELFNDHQFSLCVEKYNLELIIVIYLYDKNKPFFNLKRPLEKRRKANDEGGVGNLLELYSSWKKLA